MSHPDTAGVNRNDWLLPVAFLNCMKKSTAIITEIILCLIQISMYTFSKSITCWHTHRHRKEGLCPTRVCPH